MYIVHARWASWWVHKQSEGKFYTMRKALQVVCRGLDKPRKCKQMSSRMNVITVCYDKTEVTAPVGLVYRMKHRSVFISYRQLPQHGINYIVSF